MKRRIIATIIIAALSMIMITGCDNSDKNDAVSTEQVQTPTDNSDKNDAVSTEQVQTPTEISDKQLTTGEISVEENEEFGSIYIGLSIDELNDLGFAFGDSVDIVFSNGKTLEDIPYYSGYYTSVGELLLCGYPGYPHPVIARNFGQSTWEEFGLSDDSFVTITLREKGKYTSLQQLFSLSYSDNRDDFDSDIIFANFREIKGGKLKKGCFYRSASPCDNSHERAACVNNLVEKTGVNFVINLSDNEKRYDKCTQASDFESTYYDELYKNDNVLLLGLNANYRSEEFGKKLSEAFLIMTEHDTPCLIHCVEGKDRTGFACALLLMLAGATETEIVDDYMITFENYYNVTKEENYDRYTAIKTNFDDFIYCICDVEKGTDIGQIDLKSGAEDYLRRNGLTEEQISDIEDYITQE